MKDREKRINEMSRDMCFCDNCSEAGRCYELNCETTWVAEKLIDLNYQKIDKDKIVFSKEEYQRNLNNSFNFGREENKKYYDNYVIPQKIKETVDNIINKLMNYNEFLLHADANGHLFYVDFAAWLDEVAKQLKEN